MINHIIEIYESEFKYLIQILHIIDQHKAASSVLKWYDKSVDSTRELLKLLKEHPNDALKGISKAKLGEGELLNDEQRQAFKLEMDRMSAKLKLDHIIDIILKHNMNVADK